MGLNDPYDFWHGEYLRLQEKYGRLLEERNALKLRCDALLKVCGHSDAMLEQSMSEIQLVRGALRLLVGR